MAEQLGLLSLLGGAALLLFWRGEQMGLELLCFAPLVAWVLAFGGLMIFIGVLSQIQQ